MMTKDQIEASIAALRPAPEHETLHQVAVRVAEWVLSTIEDEHPAIAETRSLYARAINDSGSETAPTLDEWGANIDALDSAHDIALDLALAFALALARDRDLALANANANANANARALVRLLGTRIEPMMRLDGAVLAALSAPGCELYMGSYHECETTHCRAGWAITLHPMGRALEAAFGSWLAGAVIYQVSTGRVPDFFADDDDALADIKRCAHAEAA